MGSVLRAAFGYCFLVFMVRIVGRRPGKQITPFEFVLVFFMGGVTLTPLVSDDRSLTNAMIQILTVASIHYLIAWLKQISPAFGRVVDGTPLVLIEKNKLRTETLNKMRIRRSDIMAMARDSGIKKIDQIDYAILERNGEISVLEKK